MRYILKILRPKILCLSLEPKSPVPQFRLTELNFKNKSLIYTFHIVTYKVTVPRISNEMGRPHLADRRGRAKIRRGRTQEKSLRNTNLNSLTFPHPREVCTAAATALACSSSSSS